MNINDLVLLEQIIIIKKHELYWTLTKARFIGREFLHGW